jgi:hypothetical protein
MNGGTDAWNIEIVMRVSGKAERGAPGSPRVVDTARSLER